MVRPIPDQPERPLVTHLPLVGRERELELLHSSLDSALAGMGRLVLIGGEAGIGKTAVVDSLALTARERGAIVLTGHCYDLTVTPPYGPWVEIARRYQPDGDLPAFPAFLHDAQALAALGNQGELFAAVTAFFTDLAGQQPLVLILDDLHWADQGSLDLLRHLSREAAGRRLLLLVTYRSDELTRRHPLSQLVPLLVREAHAERLTLAPLDQSAIMALVAARYDLAEEDQVRLAVWLGQRADGHPLYLRELLHSLEDERVLARSDDRWTAGDLTDLRVPPLVRDVIEARPARFDDNMRELLEIAAVIGHEVPIDLWIEISGADETLLSGVLERMLEARVIEELRGGNGVRFTHALVRETLYEGIVSLRRRAWHRRVGDVLSSRPNADPDAIATHYQQAADPRAVDWLVQAGERAQRGYAWITAVERYETALTSLNAAGGDLGARGWLHYRIARLERFQHPREAIDHLDEALRCAEHKQDDALAAAARYSRGLCSFYKDNFVEAIAEMSAGADMLESLPLEEQCRLDMGPDDRGVPVITNPRGFLVAALSVVGRLEEASRMGEATREGAPKATALGELGWAHYGDRYGGLGFTYALMGRADEARTAYERARNIFRATGHYSTLAAITQIQLMYVSLTYRTEYLIEHQQLVTEVEVARSRSAGTIAASPGVVHVLILALVGRWDEAVADAEAGVTSSSSVGMFSWEREICQEVLGVIAQARGELDKGWSYVRALLPSERATEPGTQRIRVALEGQRLAVSLALDAGNRPLAEAWLETHADWLDWSGAVLGRAEQHLMLARLHRLSGDDIAAHVGAMTALQHASNPRQPLALIAAHRTLGELLIVGGQHDEAAQHLSASLELADACSALFERALTQVALAELHIATGRKDVPRALLDEVQAACESLGARPTLDRVAALQSTIQHDRTPSNYPAGLSRREVEVLRLVANGLTDAGVAEQLFISPRTVGTHLTSIYTKLDVSSRTAAARFAVEQGLV